MGRAWRALVSVSFDPQDDNAPAAAADVDDIVGPATGERPGQRRRPTEQAVRRVSLVLPDDPAVYRRTITLGRDLRAERNLPRQAGYRGDQTTPRTCRGSRIVTCLPAPDMGVGDDGSTQC